ncbi:hypothetical protein HY502_00750 [Candidatus Woesebacteria bacterium]|nr:hypothetical protein [Candidatus Woesebacteria bacterium]
MGSISRHSIIKKRRNFLPTFILTTTLWGAVAGIINFVEPETLGVIPLFFILIFFALLFTSSLVFGNRRRGLAITAGLTLFLLLRYFGIGNILNFLLIAALIVTTEVYLAKK